MKKVFSLIICTFFTLNMFAVARYWVGGGSSANWNATSPTNWSATSGGANNASVPGSADDVTFDGAGGGNSASTISAIITIKSFTATSGYTNTITRNAVFTVAGNVTLDPAMTWAGTSGMTISANCTFTSNGVTWDRTLSTTVGPTITLSGNLTLSGLLLLQGVGSTTINKTTNETITCGGGITSTAISCQGTAKIILTGGTWSGGNTIANDLDIQGNVTISGSVNWWGGANNRALTYVSGTVTTTGSTLTVQTTSSLIILATSGITWNNVQLNSNLGGIIKLTEDFNVGGLLTLGVTSVASNINNDGSTRTINCSGGLTSGITTGSLSGTANIKVTGGTISSTNTTGYLAMNLEIAGNVTFSGNLNYKTRTLLYTSGTVTTTSSTLTALAPVTLNTNGISWNNVTFNNTVAGATATISSALTVTGTLTYSGTQYVYFSGSDIDASGDVIVTNSSSSSSGGGTTNLNFIGSGSPTLTGSGTAGQGRLPNVVINKSGGTLALASVISCAENWTYTTGTVSSGSSTVDFYNSKNLDGQGTSATMSFNNVEAKSGTRTLTGNFIAAGDFTIASGATLDQNDKNMNIGGNWSNSGTYTTNTGDLVTFDGSGAQSLSKTTSHETFYNVTMNKSGNTLTLSNTSVVINEALSFTLGTITTGSYNVKLIDNATSSGASDTHGFIIGNVKKVGNDAFTFPTGDVTSGYHPIAITAPSSATDEFTAKYFNANPQSAYGAGANVSGCEYWTLTRDVGSSDVSVSLNWNSNSCNVVTPISLMSVAHWDGSNWNDLGNGGTTGISLKGSVKTAAAVTSYTNGFALGSCSGKWVQKTDFGGVARTFAVGFSIGSKGYIGTGSNWADDTFYKDFWEYDPSGNTWTQKADFGGTARKEAVGFAIGSKGYIGTGYDGVNLVQDFWEYDPSGNSWTQKANFGGASRYSAVGFATTTKGYIGTGVNQNNAALLNDFWEYDPSGNTWTQKANFGGTARNAAIGMTINGKGYIGLGAIGTTPYYTEDFWEYDPSGNSWSQKADLDGPSIYANEAVCFSTSSKGYVGWGSVNSYYEYDPSGDSWTQVADFDCGDKYAAVGFSISGKGYVGTGYDCNGGAASKKFWEYTPGTCSGGNMRIANTALTSNDEQGQPQIYPNPARNEAILNYMLAENQKGSVHLYSVMGQKIVSYELKQNEALKIDLSGIQTGIYFYNVEVHGKKIYSDKLIVIK